MEVDILKKILERRLEDEERGVDAEINITESMKRMIERNRSDLFHPNIPFNFHLLSWWEDGAHRILFIREAKVVGSNRIFIPTDEKIRGRASFMVCQYANIIEDEVSGCVEIEALPVTRMAGWQFKGKVLPHNRGVILLVDEVYCAISGKKLQETPERYKEKLIKSIVKFFHEISGPVALRIANEVLEKSGMFVHKDFTIKYLTDSAVNYEEVISRLIKRYAKIFGERLVGRLRKEGKR